MLQQSVQLQFVSTALCRNYRVLLLIIISLYSSGFVRTLMGKHVVCFCWILMDSCGLLSILRDSYVLLWIKLCIIMYFMYYCGFGFIVLLDCYGSVFFWICVLLDSCGFLWNVLDSYGFLCILLDSYGF